MRKLFVLISFAVALHAGAAHADTKRVSSVATADAAELVELKQSVAEARAKLQKLYQQPTTLLHGKPRPRGKK